MEYKDNQTEVYIFISKSTLFLSMKCKRPAT